MSIAAGKKAPNFSLEDQKGNRHSLQSLEHERVVLYFYPKDDTPGCTLEAIEFSRALSRFKRLKVAVVGISGGDNRSKSKFCMKHDLSVLLLSDPDFAVSEAYGVYGKKQFMGRTFKGIHRTTFLVNTKRGVIEHVFEAVKPEGHAQEVLEYLAESSSSSSASNSTGQTMSRRNKSLPKKIRTPRPRSTPSVLNIKKSKRQPPSAKRTERKAR